jgi:hypothetical protein
MKNILLILILSLLISLFQSFPQSGIKVNSLPPSEAKEYVSPLSTWFGTYFNSGTYYDASVPKIWGFKFNLVGLYTVIPEDQKTYKPNPQLSGVGDIEPTATIFGNKASYYLGSKGFYTYPTGLALNAVPFAIYQIAGSFYNTELMIRYFPNSKFDNTKVGMFGFGIKHEISSYFPMLPVDIAVQILYGKLDFEYNDDDPANYTKIKSNNFAFNVHASKTFSGMFIIYSGLQYESSSMDFSYYFEDENNDYPQYGNKVQDFNIDGDNVVRFTLGGAIKLGVFVVNADLNITKFTTYTTGLSLDF